MKVLVLGGSGLIGRAVVTELVIHRYEVLALNRSEPAAGSLRQLGANVLIPIGVNAGSGLGFPKPRKCESMAAYLGGRSDGCSNRITVGF